jgi:hypothetical protein
LLAEGQARAAQQGHNQKRTNHYRVFLKCFEKPSQKVKTR